MSPLPAADLAELQRAKEILEHPSLAIRIADAVGTPIEAVLNKLPVAAQRAVATATRTALERSLDVALTTLDRKERRETSDWLHRGIVMASGAAGGAAGVAGFAIELPFSLTIMLRSIADHARAQGEDLSRVEGRLECVTVFAYGSRSAADDAASSAYFAVRAAMARSLTHAAEYVAERGLSGALAEKTAPAMAQLLTRIAHRLGLAVADKAAIQLVPVLGAAGGAAINALFIDHYQETAWAHFTVRRLEREFGAAAVRTAYDGVRLLPS